VDQDSPGGPRLITRYTLDEWMNPDVGFTWVLQQLRDRKILDDHLVKAAWRIKDNGDGVAHYAARQDRAEFREIAKQHRQPWTTPPLLPTKSRSSRTYGQRLRFF